MDLVLRWSAFAKTLTNSPICIIKYRTSVSVPLWGWVMLYFYHYIPKVFSTVWWSFSVTGQENGSNGKYEQAYGKSVLVGLWKPLGLIGLENKGSEPHTATFSVSSHKQHSEAVLISLNYVITKFSGESYNCLQCPVAGNRMFHSACEDCLNVLNHHQASKAPL